MSRSKPSIDPLDVLRRLRQVVPFPVNTVELYEHLLPEGIRGQLMLGPLDSRNWQAWNLKGRFNSRMTDVGDRAVCHVLRCNPDKAYEILRTGLMRDPEPMFWFMLPQDYEAAIPPAQYMMFLHPGSPLHKAVDTWYEEASQLERQVDSCWWAIYDLAPTIRARELPELYGPPTLKKTVKPSKTARGLSDDRRQQILDLYSRALMLPEDYEVTAWPGAYIK